MPQQLERRLVAAGAEGRLHVWAFADDSYSRVTCDYSLPQAMFRRRAVGDVVQLEWGGPLQPCLLLGATSPGTIAVWDVDARTLLLVVHSLDYSPFCLQLPDPGVLAPGIGVGGSGLAGGGAGP